LVPFDRTLVRLSIVTMMLIIEAGWLQFAMKAFGGAGAISIPFGGMEVVGGLNWYAGSGR